ncbi:MAG: MFS transporter [Thermoplasmatales archaeon]|nr:MFS transporter [Candidatus Thermoplasmatota archaeon]MCL6003189.1 MFS transporter [Candidatus Thermoplasmatota archaeon]MDA8055039.1 MFS transporter [Thermoplasmatales archaeon]
MATNFHFVKDFSGISRDSKLLIGGGFLGNLALGLIFTDLSYFLHTVRGISIVYAGLVFTIEGIAGSVLAVPLGILSDRNGRKKMIVYGNLILGGSVVLIAIATNLIQLYVASIFIGISDAAFTASGGAMLSEISTNEKRTATFSLYALAANGAWAGGGFLLYLIYPLSNLGINQLSAHLILYIALGLATIVSTILLVRIREPARVRTVKNKKIISSDTRNIITKYVLSNIGIAIGAGLFVPLMSQWFSYKYAISDTISGPILGLSGLLLAFSALIAPALGRKMGIINAMVVTMLASTVFLILTPIPGNYQISAVFYILRSLLMNVSGPLSNSLIMGIIPPEQRGATSGITSIFFRMPNSLSTYPGSLLMKDGNLSMPFYIAAILYVASIVSFYGWFRRVKPPEEVTAK